MATFTPPCGTRVVRRSILDNQFVQDVQVPFEGIVDVVTPLD
jgi:hypothetical protein